MIRLLLLGLAVWLAAKVFGSFFKPSEPPVEVRGNTKNKPLDLTDEDVEDVDFKEDSD